MRIGIFTDTYMPFINGVTTSVLMLKKGLERYFVDCFSIGKEYIDKESLFERIDNDFKKVKQLIEAGADVNATDDIGRTALMVAALKNATLTDFLIKHGANVNAKDKYGYNALMRAGISNIQSVAAILIYYDADITAQTNRNSTALLGAVVNNATDVAELLIRILTSANKNINGIYNNEKNIAITLIKLCKNIFNLFLL